MDLPQLTPRRPYLLRAFYEWLLDNQLTPHLVVDVTLQDVQVPMEYARDGQIVLNIAPRAVGNLELANDEVRFNARFGGVPRQVSVPLAAVLAIYARENGAGTMFEPEAAYDEDVASLNDDDNDASGFESETVMSVIDGDKPDNGDDNDPDDTPPPPRGGRNKKTGPFGPVLFSGFGISKTARWWLPYSPQILLPSGLLYVLPLQRAIRRQYLMSQQLQRLWVTPRGQA